MLYERPIVNAADGGRVHFEAWFRHPRLLAWTPVQDTGNQLSNFEQPAFQGQVDNTSISLTRGAEGRGSHLRLAANGCGVIATTEPERGRHPSLQFSGNLSRPFRDSHRETSPARG